MHVGNRTTEEISRDIKENKNMKSLKKTLPEDRKYITKLEQPEQPQNTA